MQVEYHPDTDMLYMKLADGVSVEAQEVVSGIVLDFDATNQIIGVEIEDASQYAECPSLTDAELIALAEQVFINLDHSELEDNAS